MEKTYQPQQIETKLYQNWEEKNYFSPSGQGNPYCIMIPPPNVTGFLHMGHGFQQTLMDILIRYHRMSGDNTLWQPGMDHAGIATQMVVERQLAAENKSRHDIGREKFEEKTWEWKETSGGNIMRQIRRLGASVDWQRERFTMDKGLSDAVNKVFIDLVNKGIIYRKKRLVNWDPKFLTAISDLEVINEEEQGHIWHLRYPVVGSNEVLVVATTRPETLFGDSAVAVHPKDERYKKLIGEKVHLPLCDRMIPIIADDYVDPEFGTGCVKITPAHDFNDYEVGLRHDLPQINILTPEAHINEHAPKAYFGLERFAARKKTVEDLDAQGFLEKIEKHTHKIPRGDRSGVVIEPYLTDQWYMKMQDLAEPAIDAVRSGKVKFVPENWDKTYYHWMENIQDWCISRQLWWGHRIPAWYDEDGAVYAGQSEHDVRTKYKISDDVKLKQDEDVLDTWFSSALWPFSTLGWPEKTVDLKTFYPTNVLVTGFDIIFFWVARMMMMGLEFMDDIPFDTIYIHGLIRDAQGQKMSKSKGNVLDPIDLIDGIGLEELVTKRTSNLMQQHLKDKIEKETRKDFPNGIPESGTDALRFTYCALASNARDIRFDISRLEGYRNFCNKLWNAARYVLMNVEDKDCSSENAELSIADRWIVSRLQTTIEQAHKHIAEYRFDLLAHCLYDFTWNEYCDWYLELSKPVLYDESFNENQKRGTRHTLIAVLESLLRLMHPLMPFITEEIWQRVAPLTGNKAETIMLQSYPVVDETQIDQQADADIEWMKKIIIGIRTIRAEMNISPNKQLTVFLAKGSADDANKLEQHQTFLIKLAKLENIKAVNENDELPATAVALADHMELHIPMAGLIDKDQELDRLAKEIAKSEKEILLFEKKLGNPNFTDKAPADVVAKEQEKLDRSKQTLEKLSQQKEKIEQL